LCTHEFAGILLATYFVVEQVFALECTDGHYNMVGVLRKFINLLKKEGMQNIISKLLRDRPFLTAFITSLSWGIISWISINIIYPRVTMYTLTPMEILLRFKDQQFILTSLALIGYACVPFGLLPLKSWYLLSLLPFAAWGVSFKYMGIESIGWPQGYYYLPLLYIAFVDGLRSTKGKRLWVLLVIALTTSILLTPLTPTSMGLMKGLGIAYATPPYDDHHVAVINGMLDLIPSNTTVVAQSPISIALANRLYTFIYMPKDLVPDYIVMDFTHPLFKVHKYDQLLVKALDQGYGIYAYADGVLVLKRDYQGDPIILEPLRSVIIYPTARLWHWKVDSPNSIAFDPQSSSQLVLKGEKNPLWFGPYMPLMRGTYQVTFRIKIEGNFDCKEPLLLFDVSDVSKRTIIKTLILNGRDVPKVSEYFNVTLFFSAYDVFPRVEFRGFKLNEAVNVYLDYIEVRQINFTVSPYDTMLIPIYFDVVKGENYLLYAIHKPEEGEGTFIFGPYITLPRGRYVASFYVEISSANSYGDVMVFDVYRRGIILAQVNLTSTDVGSIANQNKVATFFLYFYLEDTCDNIEFRIHVLNIVKVVFFGVHIYKTP
jgi:hypothetical protein